MQALEFSMPCLTAQGASEIVSSAMRAASHQGLRVAVAVVDSAGLLLAFQRDREAFSASVELAMAKAKTAAAFQKSTQIMQQSLEQGRYSYLALPGALPLAGGVPLISKGVVIGAVGISGASSTQDAELAMNSAREAGWAGEIA